MLAPISWLKDYVNINVSPETLAKKLVAIGFEVEEIIYQEKQVSKVVVGKILSVEKHPNADRLRVTKIDAGKKIIQVVTNVPLEGGETIAVALDGAELAGGHKIAAGELRGVRSEGMLCGLEELGMTTDDAEGQTAGEIIRFPDDTQLGLNALAALGYNDVILDVGVTANRPDCNSIYKLAKEVAVALKTNCREPEISYESTGASVEEMVSVSVEAPDLCPRYMAGGVRNVRIFPSDAKIKKRLRAVGIRPINNIVDITNYVLTEIGQPMHAFDGRELTGGRIVVRRATEGERIVTLDGKDNNLRNDMLVICDLKMPVAVAGVMGGVNSGIKEDTSTIIFESARFARDSVRRTSRALNLRSDSSARYEKGIDFASQEYGLKRALTLIFQTGSGEIAKDFIDVKVDFERERKIEFSNAQLEKILGCAVPSASLKSILTRLGIKVERVGKTYTAFVPDARDDIVGVNDIAEEFIRVYGYNHIEPTLFEYSPLTQGGKTPKALFIDKVKDILAAAGLSECMTYSFTSPKFAELLGLNEDCRFRRAIRLINPLGEALSVMRTMLTHSMLETMTYNISRFNKSAALFEVGKAYIPKQLPLTELPAEEEKLAIGTYGSGVDFFWVKAVSERLFDAFGLKAEYRPAKTAFLHPGRCADVYVNGEKIGFVGQIHPDAAKRYGAECELYVAEYDLDALFAHTGAEFVFHPLSKYPSVERDLAVVVGENVTAAELTSAVEEGKIKNLVSTKVFDTYRSAQIGEGKKSVAMSFVFSSLERTLTDEEVSSETDKILRILKKKTGAVIRL